MACSHHGAQLGVAVYDRMTNEVRGSQQQQAPPPCPDPSQQPSPAARLLGGQLRH
jgi:hypothetical protein